MATRSLAFRDWKEQIAALCGEATLPAMLAWCRDNGVDSVWVSVRFLRGGTLVAFTADVDNGTKNKRGAVVSYGNAGFNWEGYDANTSAEAALGNAILTMLTPADKVKEVIKQAESRPGVKA
jgi:hypothetical protein